MTKKLKVLELYAGTRSIGKAFEKRGHEVYSIEWDEKHPNINWYADISKITAKDILERFGQPDIIWMSPDCTTYSMAGISHHRRKAEDGQLEPISDYAKFCDELNWHTRALLEELKPKYYFIENPRGGMRKMHFAQNLPFGGERHTVTYCQYTTDLPLEQRRMKPTDILTNHPDPKFKAPCKNGAPCHVSAPRGSATGTQGIKGSVDRSRIPEELCNHVAKISEE
ncbi:putative C-5 cytosine-specific DNA methylase I [Bacillus phage BCP8-2]|uniref:Putative C-5 cytosine-specific DNA methylase I n=1 Tax=Bacillus phage BCP8-2 TaxID=1129192 RepID=A0A0E3D9R0_9CAUD|nr:DNA methyltransferase [Bacillus phage BCP8-2]AHJ87217.1 putative C-5 cytosine-specific DNA methylase I [Bacillus phage BCP8-2]